MLAMTSVTVEKCVSDFLYSTGGPPKCHRAQGNLPPSTVLLGGPGYVNNALIMHLKN